MLVPSSVWEPMIKKMELNKLCSMILEKTIADQDMYQNGLTKIFFRAGMLAALESLRSSRLNAMVTVVQKNVRRRQAMMNYRALRGATIKIQTWWRGILARRLVLHIRREASALRLQVGLRRYAQRKRFLDIRKGVVLLQSRRSIVDASGNPPHLFKPRNPWCSGSTTSSQEQTRRCCNATAVTHSWSVSHRL
jgi:myosin V